MKPLMELIDMLRYLAWRIQATTIEDQRRANTSRKPTANHRGTT